MSEQAASGLEAKLYEAIDQLATVTGIAGARSDEAGVIQAVGENAASASTAADGASAPSSVILSGVTSLAPRDAAASARDESAASSPLAGSGGGRQPGAATASDPTVRAEPLRDTGLDSRDTSPGSPGLVPGAPVPAAGAAATADAVIAAADGADPDAQNGNQPVAAGAESETALPETLTPGTSVAEAVDAGSGSTIPAPTPGDTVQNGGPSGPSPDGSTPSTGSDLTPQGSGIEIGALAPVDLGGVTAPVGEVLAGVNGPGGLLDSGLLDGGLLGPAPNQAGDTDLTVDVVADLVGAPILADLDVVLDPIENLLGTDIDFDLDAVVDLGGVTAPVGEVLAGVTGSGGLLEGGLLGSAPNQPGDTDLTVDVVVELVGAPIPVDLDVALDPIENLLGTDIDIDLDAVADLGGVTASVGEIVTGVTTPVLETVSDITGGLLDAGLLGPAPNQAGDTDLTLDVVADLVGAPILADLDVLLDPIENLLGTDIDIDLDAVADLGDVTAPVGEVLAGVTGPGGLFDGGALDGGLLGSAPNQAGDTDLTVDVVADLVGTPIPVDLDVGLNPVEDLLGTDIDIDLDAVADLGGVTASAGEIVTGVTAPVLETVSDITGSLLDGGLLGPAPNQAGDTDLTVDVVADLVGAPILADLDVGLDPVENLLGTDIDIDLDAVADLGGVIAPVGEILAGVTGPGGLLDGGLLGPVPNQAGDTDLTVDVVADLVGTLIPVDLDVGLDPVEDLLGTDIDIDIDLDAVADLGGVTAPVGEIVTDVTTPVLETVSDITGGLLDGGLLGPVPNQAGDTDLTVDVVADLVGTPIPVDLDVGLNPVEDLLGTDMDIDIDAVADLGGVTAPVGEIVTDVTTPVRETVSDITGGLLDGGLLGPVPNQAGDTDLTVDVVADLVGTPIPLDLDVGLDPVENLLGTDIDIDLDAIADLGGVTAPVGEILAGVTGPGGLLDGGLLGSAPNQPGDTDLTVDVVADLVGTPIPVDLDVGLDPIENLLGADIDIDLDAVADLGGTLTSIGVMGDHLDLSPGSSAVDGDDDISLELAADVPGLDPLLDDLTAGLDIDIDAIEQLLDTDIDLDLDFGIDIGGFESIVSGGGALPGGNMTLNELMTFDGGSTGSLIGGTLDATTATLATVTSSTTSVLSSVTQSFTAKFGGGLFG